MQRVSFLRPLPVRGKMRLGRNLDGGYIIYEKALTATDVLVSYGIGWETSFEEHFNALTGKRVLMFDPTMFNNYLVDLKFVRRLIAGFRMKELREYLGRIKAWPGKRAAWKKKGIFFFNEGLAVSKTGKYDTFQQHVKRFSLRRQRILLKIDIEGAEYEIFRGEEVYRHLENVNQIIIEFHDLKDRLRQVQQILYRLGDAFEVIHIHGNNWDSAFILYDLLSRSENDIHIPNVLEVTLVRRTEIPGGDISDELPILPVAGLDFPNTPARAEHPINFI
jgi:hypothetical protein